MTGLRTTGAAVVAGVVGNPIAHSLSPTLHNAWLAAAEIDGAYVPFAPGDEVAFERLLEGFRGGVVRGVNVTLPFKVAALSRANGADPTARAAGAANLLLFEPDGRIEARNTDGTGLLAAFAEQAPGVDLATGPVVVLGAGGAAQGAAVALRDAGSPLIRIVNRTMARAEALALRVAGEAYEIDACAQAFDGAVAIVNATSVGLPGVEGPPWPLDAAPQTAAVMDMVYRPLETPLLSAARARGMPTVDGLAMLIGQARPSFEAFYGQPPPASVDARVVLSEAMA